MAARTMPLDRLRAIAGGVVGPTSVLFGVNRSSPLEVDGGPTITLMSFHVMCI